LIGEDDLDLNSLTGEGLLSLFVSLIGEDDLDLNSLTGEGLLSLFVSLIGEDDLDLDLDLDSLTGEGLPSLFVSLIGEDVGRIDSLSLTSSGGGGVPKEISLISSFGSDSSLFSVSVSTSVSTSSSFLISGSNSKFGLVFVSGLFSGSSMKEGVLCVCTCISSCIKFQTQNYFQKCAKITNF
jgi:hypothetical protein